jgi:hypothetical protein
MSGASDRHVPCLCGGPIAPFDGIMRIRRLKSSGISALLIELPFKMVEMNSGFSMACASRARRFE